MKTRLLVATLSCGLLLVGCAQKKAVKPKKLDTSVKIDKNRDNGSGRGGIENIDNRYNVDKYVGSDTGYKYNRDYDASSSNLKNIYFAVDKYAITPDKLPTIAYDAKILKKYIENGAKVRVEGNCDATGTDEYNYALGLRRAKAVKEALINKGIKPSAMTIVSYGESAPACTRDNSPECYAKNRRVEFRILQ